MSESGVGQSQAKRVQKRLSDDFDLGAFSRLFLPDEVDEAPNGTDGTNDILNQVKDSVAAIEKVRRLALAYHRCEKNGLSVSKEILDIIGHEENPQDPLHDIDTTSRIVRFILKSHGTTQGALEDIVSLLDVRDLRAQGRKDEILGRLKSLKDGWKDGAGKAPTIEAIAAARFLLKGINPMHYGVFPMPCGGVQFEPGEDTEEVKFLVQASGEILTEVL